MQQQAWLQHTFQYQKRSTFPALITQQKLTEALCPILMKVPCPFLPSLPGLSLLDHQRKYSWKGLAGNYKSRGWWEGWNLSFSCSTSISYYQQNAFSSRDFCESDQLLLILHKNKPLNGDLPKCTFQKLDSICTSFLGRHRTLLGRVWKHNLQRLFKIIRYWM